MAVPIILPKLGNTVESSIILQWNKSVGDTIAEGDILCEVETDKATMEVESPASGTLLALFYEEGDDVAVLSNIAVVGEAGESFEEWRPSDSASIEESLVEVEPEDIRPQVVESSVPVTQPNGFQTGAHSGTPLRISPRAKNLAKKKQVDFSSIMGTGPMGRIIERDVELFIQNRPAMSPVAKAMVETGEFLAPEKGSGSRGRITKADLIPAQGKAIDAPAADDVEIIPLKGVRKTIARRMLESMQTTAQLTLSSSVPAQALLDMRKWLKGSPAALGLRSITINDLILYAVVRTLPEFMEMNSLFQNDSLYKYRNINLGFAVDTPRGLVVPVIHHAGSMTLAQLADRAHQLADATLNQRITPDEMSGGTFTVSNLGNLGIEVFTPVLNLPEVAILGVGAITPKPVPVDGGYDFVPHMTLSLTINHQVVDGAPGARFLQTLAANIANISEI